MKKKKKAAKRKPGGQPGPRKDESDLRKPYPIRLSDNEVAKLEQAAEKLEQKVTKWARETLLTEADRVIGGES